MDSIHSYADKIFYLRLEDLDDTLRPDDDSVLSLLSGGRLFASTEMTFRRLGATPASAFRVCVRQIVSTGMILGWSLLSAAHMTYLQGRPQSCNRRGRLYRLYQVSWKFFQLFLELRPSSSFVFNFKTQVFCHCSSKWKFNFSGLLEKKNELSRSHFGATHFPLLTSATTSTGQPHELAISTPYSALIEHGPVVTLWV